MYLGHKQYFELNKYKIKEIASNRPFIRRKIHKLILKQIQTSELVYVIFRACTELFQVKSMQDNCYCKMLTFTITYK